MARIVNLSSWVAHGHVGLSAATPALQALGHAVTQLPTTILSNHPGWPRVAGETVPVAHLEAMLEALEENGWLDGVDAILTGYLPDPAHVDFAVEAIARVRARAPRCRVVVDPVLGDDPGGLYLPEAVARAVRDRLVPRAEILTPNRFELGWLAGKGQGGDIVREARSLLSGRSRVIVTSAPSAGRETGILEVTAARVRHWRVPCHDGVPHGVGDVFSALIAAGLGPGAALGKLQALIGASLGADHLRIAEAAPDWTGADPLDPAETEGS